MAELSPAAQAIMDAYMDEDRAGRLAVAVVLRTLADTKASEVSVEGHYRTIVDVDDIHAIADELEAQ